jgi:hypothetical protein
MRVFEMCPFANGISPNAKERDLKRRRGVKYLTDVLSAVRKNPLRLFRNDSRNARLTGFPEGRAHYKDKKKKSNWGKKR